MGAGIAQLALEAGDEVVLHDVDEVAIERGRARIRDGLARRAAKLDLDADSIDDWVDGRIEGLREALTLDALGAEADAVVEAALEDLGLKQTISTRLQRRTRSSRRTPRPCRSAGSPGRPIDRIASSVSTSSTRRPSCVSSKSW